MQLPVAHRLTHQILLTIFLVGIATALRFWPLHDLELHLPYLTFYPAVMIAALIGGMAAGLPTTLLSALIIYF